MSLRTVAHRNMSTTRLYRYYRRKTNSYCGENFYQYIAHPYKAGQDRTGQDRTGQNTTRARHGTARQGKAGSAHNWGTYDEELAQDCKHKEIIKGANEEGNEINTGGAK